MYYLQKVILQCQFLPNYDPNSSSYVKSTLSQKIFPCIVNRIDRVLYVYSIDGVLLRVAMICIILVFLFVSQILKKSLELTKKVVRVGVNLKRRLARVNIITILSQQLWIRDKLTINEDRFQFAKHVSIDPQGLLRLILVAEIDCGIIRNILQIGIFCHLYQIYLVITENYLIVIFFDDLSWIGTRKCSASHLVWGLYGFHPGLHWCY